MKNGIRYGLRIRGRYYGRGAGWREAHNRPKFCTKDDSCNLSVRETERRGAGTGGVGRHDIRWKNRRIVPW